MNTISLFTGCMGLDLGLEHQGFTTLLAIEIDPSAQASIKANRPHITILPDITQASPEAIRQAAGLQPDSTIHLLAGGPPCQAWSTAGHRKGDQDPRGQLFTSYLNLVKHLKPLYLVIENVRGILSTQNGKPFHNLIQELKRQGYQVTFNLYNSANFGTPQIRERIVLIASLSSNIQMPYLTPTHDRFSRFGLKPWVTFRQATQNLNTQQLLPKDPSPSIPIPSKNLKYFSLIKPGQNWKALPLDLQKEAMKGTFFTEGGKTGCFRRLAWDEPAPTLLTHPMQKLTTLVHPEEPRSLSIAEYKRLQDFPDDWIIKGSLSSQYKQIGNAVPILLAEAIGRTILAHSKGLWLPQPEGFRHSRYNDTDDTTWAGGQPGELFNE